MSPSRTKPDPQLNVVLAGLGVALILGALIFSGAGTMPGWLFVLGALLGSVLMLTIRGSRPLWVVGALLLAGLNALALWIWGGGVWAAIGIILGVVVGLGAAGSWALPRRVDRSRTRSLR